MGNAALSAAQPIVIGGIPGSVIGEGPGVATGLGDGGEAVVGQRLAVAVGVRRHRGRLEEVLPAEHDRDEERWAFHIDRRGLRERRLHGEGVGLEFAELGWLASEDT